MNETSRNRSMGVKAKSITIGVVMNVAILFFLVFAWLSMYLMVVKSFKSITQDQLSPYTLTAVDFNTVFQNYQLAWLAIRQYIFNSLVITLIQTAGSLLVPVITAYAFVRFRFPAKNVLFMAILALIMIPGTLTLTSSYVIIVKLGLLNSFWGIILPGIAGSIPMSLFLLRSFFGGISREFFEAGEMDGASDAVMLFNIMIPLSMPIITVLAINAFMGCWNDYLMPSLVLLNNEMQTISVALVSFTDQYYNMTGAYSVAFAGYVIASIPLIVLFSVGSKQFIAGISAGAFKM
ncbi:MAG: carbohydrate ABC transporter permease [Candidatus Borkfalkiaceae bacterium]|nr:carbohydrate ABC transporter permease [Christensenellaceae bacterium]